MNIHNYKYIISIDVGIKNCGYVVFKNNYQEGNTIDDVDIINYGLIDLSSGKNCNKISLIEVYHNIITTFKKEIGDYNEALVLIENQFNTRMKCVQYLVSSWFIMRDFKYYVLFTSPTKKLKSFKQEENPRVLRSHKIRGNPVSPDSKRNCHKIRGNPVSPDSKRNCHKINKLMSQDVMKNNIIPNFNDLSFIGYYNSLKKKDDIADAFLQGLYYIINPLTKKEIEDIQLINIY